MTFRHHFRFSFLAVILTMLVAAGLGVQNVYMLYRNNMNIQYDGYGWPLGYLERPPYMKAISWGSPEWAKVVKTKYFRGAWVWQYYDTSMHSDIKIYAVEVNVLSAILLLVCTYAAAARWSKCWTWPPQFSLRALLLMPVGVALFFAVGWLWPGGFFRIILALPWLGVGCMAYIALVMLRWGWQKWFAR